MAARPDPDTSADDLAEAERMADQVREAAEKMLLHALARYQGRERAELVGHARMRGRFAIEVSCELGDDLTGPKDLRVAGLRTSISGQTRRVLWELVQNDPRRRA